MPLYICRPPRGALTPEGKTAIAAAITSIHCAVTDAPPVFVHAFFFEHDGGEGSPGAGRTALHGTIRAGRTDAQRAEIADRLQAAVRGIAGVASETVDVTLSETPASRVMEGGEIFPEPGEEAAWLVQHEARMAAAASA